MIVRELANSMLRLTTERGYSRFQDTAKFWHGWALAAAGDVVSGSTQMRDAIAAHEAMGLINLTPLRLGLLAGIQTKAGNPADALSLLNEALATIGRTQERWFEAELHRLKADALLTSSSDHSEEAEASLRCAIGVAQEQDAKFWQLRAATSLARLWRDQGKRAEARDSSRRSTAGSPKASTRRSCKMPRRYWTS
jgi:predicted ATPase